MKNKYETPELIVLFSNDVIRTSAESAPGDFFEDDWD